MKRALRGAGIAARCPTCIAATLALLVGFWFAPDAAYAWGHFMPYYGTRLYVVGVQFDRPGNVILTALGDDVTQSSSRVASLSRAGGVLRWAFNLPEDGAPGENQVSDAALDRRGDIVLVGRDHGIEDTFPGYLTAIKLDGDTGAVRWHPALGVGEATAVSLDDAGDVFVAGYRQGLEAPYPINLALMKLSGGDGRVLWQRPSEIQAMVTDARGNVIGSGDVVVKVNGDDGGEVWRTSSFYTVVDRIHGTNVAATACEGDEVHVVVLRGIDGSELWRRTFSTGPYCSLRAAVLRSRDVVVTAVIDSGVEVSRLDGRSGATKWHRRIVSKEPSSLDVSQLAVGRGGVVIHWDGTLLRLSCVTGEETFRSLEAPRYLRRGGLSVNSEGAVVLVREADLEDGTDGFLVETFSRKLVRRGLRSSAGRP